MGDKHKAVVALAVCGSVLIAFLLLVILGPVESAASSLVGPAEPFTTETAEAPSLGERELASPGLERDRGVDGERPASKVEFSDDSILAFPTDDGDARSEVIASSGSSVGVRVIDKQGRPVRYANVYLIDPTRSSSDKLKKSLSKPAGVRRAKETDTDGLALFEEIADGKWIAWAGTTMSYFCFSDILVTANESSRLTCEIQLVDIPPEQLITGAVIGGDGKAVLAPRVSLYWEVDGKPRQSKAIKGRGKGSFSIRTSEPVENGLIVARGAGFNFGQAVLEGVTGGSRNLIIRLAPSEEILVDVQGQFESLTSTARIGFEVRRAGMWLRFKNKGSLSNKRRDPRPFLLPIEPFRIRVDHEGFSTKRVDFLDLERVGESITIELKPFSILTGLVRAGGELVDGATLIVRGANGGPKTSVNGQFRFDLESEALVSVEATHPRFGVVESDSVQLTAGVESAVALEYADFGTLRAKVLLPESEPGESASVLFLFHNESEEVSRARIHSDGRVAAKKMRSGSWSASLTTPFSEDAFRRFYDPKPDDIDFDQIESEKLGSIAFSVTSGKETLAEFDFRSKPKCILSGTANLIYEGDQLQRRNFNYSYNPAATVRLVDPQQEALVASSYAFEGSFEMNIREPGVFGLRSSIATKIAPMEISSELRVRAGQNDWYFENIVGSLHVRMSPPYQDSEGELFYRWSDGVVHCSGLLHPTRRKKTEAAAIVPSGRIELYLRTEELGEQLLEVANVAPREALVIDVARH